MYLLCDQFILPVPCLDSYCSSINQKEGLPLKPNFEIMPSGYLQDFTSKNWNKNTKAMLTEVLPNNVSS